MSRFKGRLRDRNRFTKKYPFVRAPRRMEMISVGELAIELGRLKFNDESSKTLIFEAPFEDTDYTVVAVPRNTEDSSILSGDSAQVSIYIDTTTATNSQVTVHASSNFTGEVDVIAIKVKE